MYKKKLTKLMTAGALAFVVAFSSACNNNPENTGNKLELWTMQLKPTFNDYMNSLIEDYKKTNPEIEIEWVDLPAKEIEQKTLTAIAGGKSPDVVNLNPNFTAKLAEVGALTDIGGLVEPEVKDRYFENIWQASKLGNQTFGFPWYLSTAITIYNKDLLQQAGLANPPKTFQELADMGKILKEKTGKYIFSPNFADSGKIIEYMVQEGIPLLTADNSKAAFNTPEAEKSLRFWINLSKDKVIPQDSVTQGHREIIDRFQAGETAVLISGPQFLKIVEENAPQLYKNIGVSSQITGSSGKVGVGVMNLVVPKASKNAAEAIKFAEFITNGPNQLEFSKIVTILPSIKDAAADPYFTKASNPPTLDETARAISAGQLENGTVLLPSVNKWSELSKTLDQNFQQAYLGQLTVKEALNKAEQDWNRLLQAK